MVRQWSVGTGKLLAEFRAHSGHVRTLHVSRDGLRLLTFSENSGGTLWDLPSQRALMHFRGHTDMGNDAALSYDERWIATVAQDGTIRLYELQHKIPDN